MTREGEVFGKKFKWKINLNYELGLLLCFMPQLPRGGIIKRGLKFSIDLCCRCFLVASRSS